MKKLFLILILLSSSFSMAEGHVDINGQSFPLEGNISITINGEKRVFDQSPYIINGRTVVPLKFLMDELGYAVAWESDKATVTARRNTKTITLQIGNPEMTILGETYTSDMAPLIINDRTYVPLAIIARATGASVQWIGETQTVAVKEKLEHVNLYYGRSSYDNYQTYDIANRFDEMSYAWSRIDVADGKVVLNTSSKYENLMYIPEGFDLVTAHQVKLLNIYAASDYDYIFSQQSDLMTSIRQLLIMPEADMPTFDGVVINFEGLPASDYEQFYTFLEELKATIGQKQLAVALQPREFDYLRLIDTTDTMILMLHDYESKDEQIISLSDGYVSQPLTPMQRVEEDLNRAIATMDVHQKSKVLLQINLSVVQWQGSNQFQMNRFTPSYDKLINRLGQLEASQFYYHDVFKNPYVVYTDENQKLNTIWYENAQSLAAKIKLVLDHDLGGISIWQLGNLPAEQTDEYDLNLLDEILKNR